MKSGEFVWIERGNVKMQALIVLASDNEVSLMVMFNGMFCGYVGMMPLLMEGGIYRDLHTGLPVRVTGIDESDDTWRDAT